MLMACVPSDVRSWKTSYPSWHCRLWLVPVIDRGLFKCVNTCHSINPISFLLFPLQVFLSDAQTTTSLTWPFLHAPDKCTCTTTCSCVAGGEREAVDVRLDVWNNMQEYAGTHQQYRFVLECTIYKARDLGPILNIKIKSISYLMEFPLVQRPF